MKKQDIMQLTGISKATMAKLNTNDYVSLEIIDKLSAALNCQPGDLLEYIPTEQTS
jgi:putative transcriptional regulator